MAAPRRSPSRWRSAGSPSRSLGTMRGGQRVRKPVVLSPFPSPFPHVTVLVLQELGEVEELGDELLDVHRVFHAGLPRRRHRVELPVRAVEPGGNGGDTVGPRWWWRWLCVPPFHLPPSAGCSPSALQLDVQRGEGLGADQVVHDARRVGVVRAVVKLVHGARGVLKALVPGVGGEAAGSGKVPQSLHPPTSPWFFLGALTSPSRPARASRWPPRWAWRDPETRPGR